MVYVVGLAAGRDFRAQHCASRFGLLLTVVYSWGFWSEGLIRKKTNRVGFHDNILKKTKINISAQSFINHSRIGNDYLKNSYDKST